ncbi:ParB-like nuclease domain protein [Microbacterium phage Rasputia]|nr:ParB-like nuclease domain protein [Microbacterium phage Rasputia]
MSPSPLTEPMETKVLQVKDLVPYWRNPRRISDEAVNAVMDSIREYGYQQPIVVDTENVIIMGHTRHAAVRRLGVTEIPVLVASNLTPKQVKELRTIDNRTSEFTRWDFEKLMSELEGVDSALMQAFFPEVLGVPEPEVDDDGLSMVIDAATPLPQEAKSAEFICPTCFHQWAMPVTREDIFSGELYVKEDQS